MKGLLSRDPALYTIIPLVSEGKSRQLAVLETIHSTNKQYKYLFVVQDYSQNSMLAKHFSHNYGIHACTSSHGTQQYTVHSTYAHKLEQTHSTLHHSHKYWCCLYQECSQCYRCRWPQYHCPVLYQSRRSLRWWGE